MAIALGESRPVAIPPIDAVGTRLPNVPAGNCPTVLPLALVMKSVGGPEAVANRAPTATAAAITAASATRIHADEGRPAWRLVTVIPSRCSRRPRGTTMRQRDRSDRSRRVPRCDREAGGRVLRQKGGEHLAHA